MCTFVRLRIPRPWAKNAIHCGIIKLKEFCTCVLKSLWKKQRVRNIDANSVWKYTADDLLLSYWREMKYDFHLNVSIFFNAVYTYISNDWEIFVSCIIFYFSVYFNCIFIPSRLFLWSLFVTGECIFLSEVTSKSRNFNGWGQAHLKLVIYKTKKTSPLERKIS